MTSPRPQDNTVDYSFLTGDKAMVKLIREFDWAETPIGAISAWPQSLRTAVNITLNSTVPIVMLWGEHGVMIYNHEYSLFAGARHPTLLGANVVDGWPEVADFNRNVMVHGLAGKTLAYKDQELTLYRNDKAEQVWMDLNYSPIYDESGIPAGVFAFVIETTERVLAEQKQKAAEAAFQLERHKIQQMFNDAPAYIALLSGPDHVYTLMNPLYEKLVGARNIIGLPVREALPEIAGSGLYEILDEVYETGKPYIGNELEVGLDRTGTGVVEQGFFNFVYQPIRNETGAISDVFVHAVEVTEQIKSRHVLAENKRKYDALFDSKIMAVALVNLSGEILEANKTFLQLFGYNRTDLKHGLTSKQLSAHNYAAVTENIYESLKDHGEVEPVEKNYIRKNGTEFPGLVGAAMLPGSKDQFMAFILDITETENLKAMNVAKDEFVALASHQLRTPATSVKQYIGILMEEFAGPLNEEQLQYLTIANNANERQLDIINDLLKTAQIDTAGFKLKLKKTDVREIVQAVVDQYKPVLDTKHQAFVYSAPEEPILATIDPSEIATCVANLIENASKYSASKKHIKIGVTAHEGNVEISVTDSGVGIAKEDREKIFEKFTRVNNILSDTVNGNGLGLYWVKRIVQLHHGEIKIKSTLGKGTTFILRLPV